MDSLNLPNLKPPQIADHLAEIRIDVVQRASVILLGVAGLAGWMCLSFNPFPIGTFVCLLLFLTLAAVCRRVVDEHPFLARVALLSGSAATILALQTMQPEQWIPFLILPVVLLGSVLVEHGELYVGAAGLLTTVALTVLGWRDYGLLEYSAGLLLALGIGWVISYTLITSMGWYQVTLEQSNRLLGETRQHRGELSKALKNLTQANELQRRTELELLEARHSAEEARLMKERFAAKVSHELRTPLALIAGFSEVMYSSPEIYGDVTWTPMMRRDIAQVYHNSEHLLAMIDDILNLSRFDLTGFSITLENVPLQVFLEETATIARDLFRSEQVRFSLMIEEKLPVVHMDPTRIRQVVLNLINNARRFTEQGEVVLSASTNEHEVQICVRDTGPGIAADKINLIFEEFYQLDERLLKTKGGTGLGLAICKHFVETHGGHIWAESILHQGSIFKFTLPCGGPFIPGKTEQVRPAGVPTPRVLVVGADDHVLAMLRSVLAGYDVRPVVETRLLPQAVAFYHPRALILNLLPGDENEAENLLVGLEIPLIRCSLPSTLWLIKKLGVQACLFKPITRSALLQEMERLPLIKRILVVDDDVEFIHLIERILQSIQSELEVIVAGDGMEGLALMRVQRPDLVLLDLTMPKLDGFGVIRQMKQEADLEQIPVVLLTATLTPERLMTFPANQLVVERSSDMKPREILTLIKASLDGLQTHYDESTEEVIQKIGESEKSTL